MTTEDRHDAILIKVLHWDEDDRQEDYVCSWYTTAIDETIKMFQTMKENNIPCCFNEYDDGVTEEYRGMDYCIEDIYVQIGSKVSIPVIIIYI